MLLLSPCTPCAQRLLQLTVGVCLQLIGVGFRNRPATLSEAGSVWDEQPVAGATAQSQHSHSIVTAQSHDVGGGLARGYWGWLAWVDSLADLGGVGLSAGLAAGAVGGQSPAGGLEKLLHILQ